MRWLPAMLCVFAGCRTPPATTPVAKADQVVDSGVVDSGSDAPHPDPLPADAGRGNEEPEWFDVTPNGSSLGHLSRGLIGDAGVPEGDRQIFPDTYSSVEGVFTFRGGPSRTGGAWGTVPKNPRRLEVAWRVGTSESFAPWNGGAGWTGEPVIVRWPAVIRHSMPALKKLRQKDGFTEVIQGSLDGNVYFIDLATGKRSRPPLHTGNPIKGSVSLDPRAYPLLFVGQGIPWRAPIGVHVYDLISQKEVFFGAAAL